MFKVEKCETNLVVCFDKDAEAVRGGQTELSGDVQGEVLDPGACHDLKYLERDERGITKTLAPLSTFLARSCRKVPNESFHFPSKLYHNCK